MLNIITRERALIFRITHYQNLRWILANGLQCKNSYEQDPNFIPIGHAEIIDRRTRKIVTEPPGGVLADYVPFYFTPRTPMLMNIRTGRLGLKQWPLNDIAVLVGSLPELLKLKRVVYSDRNAASATADFFSDEEKLGSLPWNLWRASDFRRDDAQPDKIERYMAEALIHGSLRALELQTVVCYSQDRAKEVERWVNDAGLTLPVIYRPGWYC